MSVSDDVSVSKTAGGEKFILKLYDQTLQLAEDTMAILPEGRAAIRAKRLDHEQTLALVTETLRLSARIMHCMAWLMARRAVLTGEISEEEGRGKQYSLSGHETITQSRSVPMEHMPPAITSLIDRSEQLFRQLDRLDRDINLMGTADRPLVHQWQHRLVGGT